METLYSTIYDSKYFIELNIDKSTQYVALWTHKRHLSGELWSVFYEYFNRNWSCYKGFLLYYTFVRGIHHWIVLTWKGCLLNTDSFSMWWCHHVICVVIELFYYFSGYPKPLQSQPPFTRTLLSDLLDRIHNPWSKPTNTNHLCQNPT